MPWQMFFIRATSLQHIVQAEKLPPCISGLPWYLPKLLREGNRDLWPFLLTYLHPHYVIFLEREGLYAWGNLTVNFCCKKAQYLSWNFFSLSLSLPLVAAFSPVQSLNRVAEGLRICSHCSVPFPGWCWGSLGTCPLWSSALWRADLVTSNKYFEKVVKTPETGSSYNTFKKSFFFFST